MIPNTPTPLEHLALLLGLAKQAATWWCTAIAGTDYVSKFALGDNSVPPLSQASLPAVSLARFEQLLAEYLVKQMVLDPYPMQRRLRSLPGRHLLLQVGYGPCDTLADLADLAGLHLNAFPWKTRMYINWDARAEFCCVEARQGHGYALERSPLAA